MGIKVTSLKDPSTGDRVTITESDAKSLAELSRELNVGYKSFHCYASTHGLQAAVDYYRGPNSRTKQRRLKEQQRLLDLESGVMPKPTGFTVGNHFFKGIQEAVRFCGCNKLYRQLSTGQGRSWSKQERLDYIAEYGISARTISLHTGRLCATLYTGTDERTRFIVYEPSNIRCYVGKGLELLDLDIARAEPFPTQLAVPHAFWYNVYAKFNYSLPNPIF